MSLLPILVFSLFGTAQADTTSADACASLIPPALRTRLQSDLADYRLPTSQDAGEREKDLMLQGDWPCPYVVAGDFDGNGSLDRALLLPARNGQGVRLVGVLNQDGQWQLSLTEDWPLALVDSELRPLESGLYQRADANAEPRALLDQLASLQADFTPFRAGRVSGFYHVYACNNGRWQKLTLAAQ